MEDDGRQSVQESLVDNFGLMLVQNDEVLCLFPAFNHALAKTTTYYDQRFQEPCYAVGAM